MGSPEVSKLLLLRKQNWPKWKKKKYFVLFKDQECCKWSVKLSLVKEIGNWFPDLFETKCY